MKHLNIIILGVFFYASMLFADESNGEKLFKEYCWGCHHQTAEAFGPSFKTIANRRNSAQIIAQIITPDATYKSLGYTRNSMPDFHDLTAQELQDLVTFIYTFKDKK